MTMGHETAGSLAAIGSAVHGFAEGEAVLVGLVWACGRCRACLEGRDNTCLMSRGSPPCPGLGPDGGMAEYIKVPARHLHALRRARPRRGRATCRRRTHGVPHDRGRPAPPDPRRHRRRHRHRRPRSRGPADPPRHQPVVAPRRRRRHTGEARPRPPLRRAGSRAVRRRHGAIDPRPHRRGQRADVVLDFVGIQPTVTLATSILAPDAALRFIGIGGGAFGTDHVTGQPPPVGRRRPAVLCRDPTRPAGRDPAHEGRQGHDRDPHLRPRRRRARLR